MKNKHFLKLLDFTPEEIEYLLDFAADLKAKKKAGIPHRLCEGKLALSRKMVTSFRRLRWVTRLLMYRVLMLLSLK